jgi:4,4'-diaponeurosporenoate glycosyltransferase
MTSSLVLALAGWLAGWILWGRPTVLGDRPAPPSDATDPGAGFTVVIPARDEEHVLPLLLADLQADRRAVDRVLVVDDHSSDATSAVATAAGAGIEVISAPALPRGWTGKNWACHVGYRTARQTAPDGDTGQAFAFVDADVRLEPGALSEVRRMLDARGGVVSVQPFHVTSRPDEQLSLFPGIIALSAIGAGSTTSPPNGLCGPLIATTAGDLDRVGGHEAVRDEVIEDVALGQRFVEAGIPAVVVLGGERVRYRMYPAGLAQLVEGWTKNLASGAGAVPLPRAAAAAVWITALGGAALDLFGAVVGAGVLPLWSAAGIYAAFVVQVAVLGRRTGNFPIRTAVLYPVPLLAFLVLFLRSAWRTSVRRGVVWRGRSLPVGRARVRS